MWTVFVFCVGFGAGIYFSPWVEMKISDFMGESD